MNSVPSNPRQRLQQRGVAVPVIVAVIAIVLVIALGAWFLIIKPSKQTVPAALQGASSGAVASATVAAPPPPADVDKMSVSELLEAAQKAMRQNRLLAPAGNNAFEFYVTALEKQPGNQVAQDALRETFPFAAGAAEQEINANNFEEAQREIELLAKSDPGNYTLTILRSKLDAQRKLASRAEEQQKRQDEVAAQQAAAVPQQTASPTPAPTDATQQAVQQPQVVTTPPRPAPPRAVVEQAPAPPPAQPVGETRSAKLLKSTRPSYPPAALRRRQQGYVDVEFTVDTNGDVVNAHSVGSDAGRVFERAATDAVSNWKFEPAMNNGQVVQSVLRQRIEFKL